MKADKGMTRKGFIGGMAALGAARAFAQDLSPTGVASLDAIQAEINEVTPTDFKDYCRPSVNLEDFAPLAEEPKFAVFRRLDAAFRKVMDEVRATKVPVGGVPAVWYVYNMGVVVKTHEALFSIDLQHRLAEELAPDLDFALITHNHHDHYTRRFYQTMNDRLHKTVVSNFADNYGAYFAKNPAGYTRGGKTFWFKDVTVKTSMSDHNKYLIDFTMPFEITVGDFRIFHSGDSQNIDKLNPADAPDLWFVHPFCGMKAADGVAKFHPKKTALVHLNELGHAKNRWRFTYKDGLARKAQVEAAGGVAVVPLWGERLV